MTPLFRIVYATHANGTHHKLALDALGEMQHGDKAAWTRLFLKHVGRYLEGSKAPDVTFKDFKNHVLHVAEGYWGGAPEKAEAWYRTTVDTLKAGNWADAVYAAGVLSHYYTDPIQPFHTGQTEAENAIHRAAEWSISRSYDKLRALGTEKFADIAVPAPSGPRWLSELVCDGAEYSHRYYEKLIAHYDIHKGSVRPEEGFDTIGRTIVAELLIYASKGFGRVLDAAVTEAGVAAPDVTLTAETFLAATKIPEKFIEKRLTNAEDRKLVAAIYDELKATGRVDKALPEDDRTIRDLHRQEVLEPMLAQRREVRAARVKTGKAVDLAAHGGRTAESAPATANVREPTPLPPSQLQDEAPRERASYADDVAPPHIEPHPATVIRRPTESEAIRSYLSASDDLEAAPSIGPKTAERFAAIGVHTVADFLGNNPHDMADLLDDAHFDGETLADWQDQAQLVIDVPGLKGTHAQLLVGAGYRTAEAVAEADPVSLSVGVLKFVSTSEGKRVLREGRPPDIEKIKGWVDVARHAMAA